jgi:hypothetical protein
LLISHQRLTDTYDTQNPYPVEALIKHRSGIASAQVYYTTDTLAGFNTLAMAPSDGEDMWAAQIPPQPAGTTVYYYIRGIANSGKIQVRPITAPDGFYEFDVLDTGSVTAIKNQILDAVFETQLFPNPSSAITCIPLKAPASMKVKIEVFDIRGNLVQQLWNGTLPGGESRVYIDAGQLPAGMYVVRATTPFGAAVQKLSVVH